MNEAALVHQACTIAKNMNALCGTIPDGADYPPQLFIRLTAMQANWQQLCDRLEVEFNYSGDDLAAVVLCPEF